MAAVALSTSPKMDYSMSSASANTARMMASSFFSRNQAALSDSSSRRPYPLLHPRSLMFQDNRPAKQIEVERTAAFQYLAKYQQIKTPKPFKETSSPTLSNPMSSNNSSPTTVPSLVYSPTTAPTTPFSSMESTLTLTNNDHNPLLPFLPDVIHHKRPASTAIDPSSAMFQTLGSIDQQSGVAAFVQEGSEFSNAAFQPSVV
ncbi:hypothetical protein FQN57_003401 [Myotisia sp. PD_48]|nr:hypothetical protein FQN57_003401 [Myotisia sp. PD_48]